MHWRLIYLNVLNLGNKNADICIGYIHHLLDTQNDAAIYSWNYGVVWI